MWLITAMKGLCAEAPRAIQESARRFSVRNCVNKALERFRVPMKMEALQGRSEYERTILQSHSQGMPWEWMVCSYTVAGIQACLTSLISTRRMIAPIAA